MRLPKRRVIVLGLSFVLLLSACSTESTEFTKIKKEAEQGDVDAQRGLGTMYVEGEGVDKNYNKARKWYLKAAEQGDAKAQYNLGIAYNEGLGVSQNITQAKEWFGKACDNGDQDGCDRYRDMNQR